VCMYVCVCVCIYIYIYIYIYIVETDPWRQPQVDAWIERYADGPQAAMAELLTAVIRFCGCDGAL
jgi:hypothetical protein